MNIDFHKLILLMLPAPLRKARIVAILRVLVSPIAQRYAELRQWFDVRRIRLAVTPQAEWIRYIVRREANLEITITEGDHLPYDFIVAAAVDLHDPAQLDAKRRAEALVDRYKQAGRRWRFNNTRLDVYTRWDNYRCAVGEQVVRFDRYVCAITVEICHIQIEKSIDSSNQYFILRATAQYPVGSHRAIDVELNLKSGARELITLVIPQAQNTSPRYRRPNDVAYYNIVTQSGLSDNEYKYIIDN